VGRPHGWGRRDNEPDADSKRYGKPDSERESDTVGLAERDSKRVTESDAVELAQPDPDPKRDAVRIAVPEPIAVPFGVSEPHADGIRFPESHSDREPLGIADTVAFTLSIGYSNPVFVADSLGAGAADPDPHGEPDRARHIGAA
jgi:hypothetical protein